MRKQTKEERKKGKRQIYKIRSEESGEARKKDGGRRKERKKKKKLCRDQK